MNLIFLLLLGALARKEKQRSSYESALSLNYPYLDTKTGKSSFGEIKGDALILSRGAEYGISLLGESSHSHGRIVGKKPLRHSTWRVDFSLKVEKQVEGVGIWFTPKNAEIQHGSLFGAEAQKNTLLVYLNINKDSLGETPSIGVATGADRPNFHFSKKISLQDICMIRVEKQEKDICIFYGSSLMKLSEVGSIPAYHVNYIPFISVSASTSSSGAVILRSIAVSKLFFQSAPEATEDAPRTRSKFVWLIFICMSVGVGYYLYIQRGKIKKNQKILKY
ncbi:hypothetical protein NEFER03_0485 [Nematocida sp. LUAm3]|nr:hypothetical protein NEFER03_0485 [Nematocida sp. LUAm3]KAI5175942.1 hypothetical protein NEFER02_1802 [Nematocida sp. LUAm2]KAI5178676.1 hypothetical protein NEFER01_1795 [Nematocida sp. LUAm1]